jgi:hypothetical protein
MRRREFIKFFGGMAAWPLVQPTKFHMAVNAKTAKSLGIEVPPRLLGLADEVIE